MVDMNLDRYSRQMAFASLGRDGQQRLTQSHVVVCGCGALGTSQANLLVRAGVGRITLIDRDFVDLSNLQRQSLFDQDDVQQHRPKSVAAAERLRKINDQIQVIPIVADVQPNNIESFVQQADIVLDGTDNFETRYLLNDACCKNQRPWIFGGCLGAMGQTMTVIPGTSACFACLTPEPPEPGAVETCETGGILGTIIQSIAAIQVNEAIKLLACGMEAASTHLTVIDLWSMAFRRVDLSRLAGQGCEVCRHGKYDWLEGRHGNQVDVLCGRNSVQIRGQSRGPIDLPGLAARLEDVGKVLVNEYLLRLTVDSYAITVFPDARAIVSGTQDPAVARSLVAKFIGV